VSSHTVLLNLVYEHLTEGLDHDGIRDFDRTLGADPNLVSKVGAPSRGADALMALMGGGKKKGA